MLRESYLACTEIFVTKLITAVDACVCECVCLCFTVGFIAFEYFYPCKTVMQPYRTG